MNPARMTFPLLLIATLACDEESGPNISGVDPIAIARVEVQPAIDTVYVGDTIEVAEPREFEGVAIGRSGSPLNIQLAWLSRDPSVATVDENGLVRPRGLGTARIVASAGKQGEGLLVVLREVATVSVEPMAPAGVAGEEIQLVGTATAPDGAAVRGVAWTWSSSDTAVATVDATGLVRLLAPGTATITVTGGGRSTQVPVVVS